MKAPVILLSLLFAGAPAAEAPRSFPEFAGYFSAGSDLMFVLADPTAKERSSWVKLGESWQGLRLISFDAQREVLVVVKGEASIELRLRSSKTIDSGSLPKLLRGSFSAVGSVIVYTADAEISVAAIGTIRSSSGAMTYNAADETIRGDLVIDHSAQPMLMIVKGGVVKLKEGMVTASTMAVQKKPNKAPGPTTTPVTAPAAQEPGQP